jgi:hypothetical protein
MASVVQSQLPLLLTEPDAEYSPSAAGHADPGSFNAVKFEEAEKVAAAHFAAEVASKLTLAQQNEDTLKPSSVDVETTAAEKNAQSITVDIPPASRTVQKEQWKGDSASGWDEDQHDFVDGGDTSTLNAIMAAAKAGGAKNVCGDLGSKCELSASNTAKSTGGQREADLAAVASAVEELAAEAGATAANVVRRRGLAGNPPKKAETVPAKGSEAEQAAARKAFLFRGYCEYLKYESSREWILTRFEMGRNVMFMCLTAKLLFFGHYTVYDLMARIAIALMFQPFFFMISHIYLHANMLQCFQKDGLVGSPLAFFHHYVDARLYGILPHNYRYLTLVPSDILVIPCTICFGLDPIFYIAQNLALYLDIIVHEYYHTPDRHYKSMNPLSAKFAGLYYWFQVLEKIGCVSKEKHKFEHHRERAEGMHLTDDWVDFNIPGFGYLADKLGNVIYELYMRILEHPKVRGTRLPVDVPGITMADVKRFRMWISWFWVLPISAVFYTVIKFVFIAGADRILCENGLSVHADSGYNITTPYADFFTNGGDFLSALVSWNGVAALKCAGMTFFTMLDPRFITPCYYLFHAWYELCVLKIPASAMLTYVDCGKHTGEVKLYMEGMFARFTPKASGHRTDLREGDRD